MSTQSDAEKWRLRQAEDIINLYRAGHNFYTEANAAEYLEITKEELLNRYGKFKTPGGFFKETDLENIKSIRK